MKIPQKTTSGVIGALMGFTGGQQYYAEELETVTEQKQAIERQYYPGVAPKVELTHEDQN